MKPREFKLNEGLSDALNIRRLHSYIRRYLDPKHQPMPRFRRQHIRPTKRESLVNARIVSRRCRARMH